MGPLADMIRQLTEDQFKLLLNGVNGFREASHPGDRRAELARLKRDIRKLQQNLAPSISTALDDLLNGVSRGYRKDWIAEQLTALRSQWVETFEANPSLQHSASARAAPSDRRVHVGATCTEREPLKAVGRSGRGL